MRFGTMRLVPTKLGSPHADSIAHELLDSFHRELTRFRQGIQDRGRRYHRAGRVGPLAIEPGRVLAAVQGERLYRTSWTVHQSGWTPACSCPVAPRCKHAYALGLSLMNGLIDEDLLGLDAIDRLFSVIDDRGGADAAIPARPPTRALSSRAPKSKRIEASAPPVPAEPPPSASLAELRRAFGRTNRAQVLSRMLFEAGISGVDPSHPAFIPGFDERDPELQAWLLARELLRWTLGELPPALEPFRERPDLADRQSRSQLPVLDEALRNWASRRAARAERSLRVVMSLGVTARGDIQFSIQAQQNSPRLRNDPRTLDQLRTLQSEARRRSELLTREHAELLDALIAMNDVSGGAWYSRGRSASPRGALADFLLQVMPSSAVVWSDAITESVATRCEIVPGESVRFEPTPVRIVPSFELDRDQAVIRLEVQWPDGRRRKLTEVLHFAERGHESEPPLGVVLSGGILHPVSDSPPAEVINVLRGETPLRLDRKLGEPLIRALADAIPTARQAVQTLTQRHRAQPTVLMRLDPDDWLQLRLLAHGGEAVWTPGSPSDLSTPSFEYTPTGRWERAPSTPSERRSLAATALPIESLPVEALPHPTDGEAPTLESLATGSESAGARPVDEPWFHEPDEKCVEPAMRWLESLGAKPGSAAAPRGRGPAAPDPHLGWWVRLGSRTVPALEEAWRSRPRDIRWYGNSAIDRLLGGHRSLTPRVHAHRHGVDLLSVSAEWEAEGLRVTDEDFAALRSSALPWVKLSGGWTRRETLDVNDRVSEVLADLGVELGAGEQQLSVWQLAQAREETLAALEEMGADAEAIAAVRALRERVAAFEGLPTCELPPGFQGELRPYQRRGLDFLAFASSLGLGTVLADDMGLGKTIQALAWVLHLRAAGTPAAPTLVVCPASVLHNWEREAARFAPDLRVLLMTRGTDRKGRFHELANYDLVITNYALLRRDIESWRTIPLLAGILDEAQHVKNPDSDIARAVKQLQATHRLALTGTPIENRALDLWSIVSFANPGYLGTRAEFSRRFDRADAPPHARRLLAAKLRPMLLRRLKKEVAPELPERIEELRSCEMLPAQRKYYLAELARARREVMSLADEGGVKQHKIQILAALTRLRQICCHPQLAGATRSVGSGKFEALFELLEPLLAEGHKVLLFSQFVKALELVRAEMRTHRIPHHLLTGSTTDRGRVVGAFENDRAPCVFLISLRAGGTGLNLTAASYVVLLDPWWNPAVEAQAIDRTHRIGQDRTVIAYRLLMQGTIEEKIWELQQRKAELASSLLGEDGFARRLDRESLEYLFAEE
ncbi:MAG: DEAD/DEAH box helicase [Candidatus Eisenbacteria bacterium]|uniref:DEAD/DEAH box helicase n=1 Tax=Eiseniibacteriota bacterium TaxID=2212470 RepID=A0A849SBJ4_UNCEI|nr:DEAD/DEAH box helicase [Candidatus Eisenbacteria bacterium]